MCQFKWFLQFHWSAEVTKKKENKICFITSQGKKGLSERKTGVNEAKKRSV